MIFLSRWRPRHAVQRSSFFWVWLLGGAAGAGFILLCALVLWDGWRDAERQANQAAANIVRSIEQDIARNIEFYDLSLQGVIKALDTPEAAQLTGKIRQMALFDSAAMASYLNAIRIIDETGKIVESSGTLDPNAENVADRDYFQVHKDSPDVGMYLSEPLKNSLGSGEWIIAISRRLSRPDGTFAGVAVGALDLNYFQTSFENLVAGPDSSIALFRDGGALITRKPFRMMEIGRNFSQAPLFRHYPAEIFGRFQAGSVFDNIERRFTFGKIKNLPLVVNVGLSSEFIYGSWRQKALVVGILMAALILTIVTVGFLLSRALKQRDRAEAHLRESEARYRLLADNSIDAIVLLTLDGVRKYASPAYYKLIGRTPEEMGDRPLAEFLHPDFRAAPREMHEKLQAGQKQVVALLHYIRPDGGPMWLEAISSPIRDANGALMEVVSTMRDVTRRKMVEDELALVAATDGLTGLANRRAFDARMDSELKRAIRSGANISVLMLDVDFFKNYNDTFGHQAGDEALRRVGACLKAIVGRPADFVARYGGEEFIVLLPDTGASGALEVAEAIRHAVAKQAVDHPANPVGLVTISIGLASVRPKAGDEAASLIQAADAALYRAKKNGRNRVEQGLPATRHEAAA